jgi:hypothetical protein
MMAPKLNKFRAKLEPKNNVCSRRFSALLRFFAKFGKKNLDKCWHVFDTFILNMVITWISWGAAPGYIKIAPLGLFNAFQSDFYFSKSPACSLLEYSTTVPVAIHSLPQRGYTIVNCELRIVNCEL